MKVDPPILEEMKCGKHSYSLRYLEEVHLIVVFCHCCGDIKIERVNEL